jgi:hypothetical protein
LTSRRVSHSPDYKNHRPCRFSNLQDIGARKVAPFAATLTRPRLLGAEEVYDTKAVEVKRGIAPEMTD